jgi:predicted ABC-type ATPase
MFIVAGPPGAGKSTIFSLAAYAERTFNADDRAAELNAGSYRNIPLSIRKIVNREFELFVHQNIRARNSFAVETTLRSGITFDQALLARDNGFRVSMRYVALDSVERHIERVKRRAELGGHSASDGTLRQIHASSMSNLRLALDPAESGIESVRIFDNTRFDRPATRVLSARDGRILRIAADFPAWLQTALGWTQQDLDRVRSTLTKQRC